MSINTIPRWISPSFFGGLAIFLLFLMSWGAGCSSHNGNPESHIQTNISVSSVTLIDSLNRTITLPGHPKRIIAANGQPLDLIIAFGAGDRVVGVPQNIPNQTYLIRHMPNAVGIGGTLANVNSEKILSIHPDVVIAYSDYKPKDIQQIIDADIPIIYLNCYYVPELPAEARKLGVLLGEEEKAEEYARFVEDYLALIESRIQNQSSPHRPRVYFEAYTDYTGGGRGSYADSIITILHGENIIGDLGTDSAIVSKEWIIEQNPEIIIRTVSTSAIREPATLRVIHSQIMNRPGFANVSAVKNNRVYVLNSNALISPRGIAGTLYLAKALYPDLFSDIDPEAVLKEYADRFQPDGDKIVTFYPPLAGKYQDLSLDNTR